MFNNLNGELIMSNNFYFSYGLYANQGELEKKMNEAPSKMKEKGSLKEGESLSLDKITSLGPAILKDYELCFNKMKTGSTHYEGFANIIPKEGAVVEGVLYDVNNDFLRVMDFYQGVKAKHYVKKTVTVQESLSGINHDDVVVYVADKKRVDDRCLPSRKYLDKVIKGAKENYFSEKTIENLEKWPTCEKKKLRSCLFEKKEEKRIYFAYGSNMNSSRMETRMKDGPQEMLEKGKISKEEFDNLKLDKINCLGVAILYDHDLRFNKKKKDSEIEGYANVVEQKESEVEGVIYEVDEDHLKVLDYYEGAPKHYKRVQLPVKERDSNSFHLADIYIADNKDMLDANRIPSETYLNNLIIGAEKYKLSDKTQKNLQSWKEKALK